MEYSKQEIDLIKSENYVLKEIFNSLDVNIYWNDLQGRFLGINKSNLSMLGIVNENEVLGKRSDEILVSSKYAGEIQKNNEEVLK